MTSEIGAVIQSRLKLTNKCFTEIEPKQTKIYPLILQKMLYPFVNINHPETLSGIITHGLITSFGSVIVGKIASVYRSDFTTVTLTAGEFIKVIPMFRLYRFGVLFGLYDNNGQVIGNHNAKVACVKNLGSSQYVHTIPEGFRAAWIGGSFHGLVFTENKQFGLQSRHIAITGFY